MIGNTPATRGGYVGNLGMPLLSLQNSDKNKKPLPDNHS
uniref:Uncharacterized protein n=1 Tax=Dulem virus 39 TaxID=3145757 RepID=A0AAU8B958_9CAUD